MIPGRVLVRALLAAAMLTLAVTHPSQAQRDLRGRHRPERAPPEQPAPGEYALDGAQAIEAIGRGEGPQALEYYERTAREAEQQGNQLRAARAWHAASVTARRLGRYQKAIQDGGRALDMFIDLPEPGQQEHAATMLVGNEATEARVKALLGTVGLVHLATHGELREDDPLSSAVLLVPGAGEDGRLEVREVFGLDLHARLVVLSACETGLGKLSRGDELVGLQRAFLYAGTPAVVTTLWKVDDRASYQLVRAFYDRLESVGPVAALRQAQLETERAFPHPFAWAALGLTGAPR